MVARGQTTPKRLAQLLDKCRRQRLAKKARQQAMVNVGVHAINGHKPLVTRKKRLVVGLPGLIDVDLLAELIGKDQFLGTMRTAIINKDVQSFNKLGAFLARMWPKAAVANNCILIDKKLAIPEPLRSANLAYLHRSHPGQAAMIGAMQKVALNETANSQCL